MFPLTPGHGQQHEPRQNQQNDHGDDECQHFSPRIPNPTITLTSSVPQKFPERLGDFVDLPLERLRADHQLDP